MTRRLAAYYRVMAEDLDFRASLTQLQTLVPAAHPTSSHPPPELHEALDAFVRAWHFPEGRGVLDLWECLVAARGRAEPWRWLTAETDLGEGVEVGFIPVDERGDAVLHLRAGIDPHTLDMSILSPRFRVLVDPVTEDWETIRGRIRSVAQKIEDDMLEQARRAQREVEAMGRRSVPPQHRSEKELLRLARRLFLRTRGHGPAQIAALEEHETSEVCDPETVRPTVRKWARELRVTLPPLRSGRPRRNPGTFVAVR